MSTATHVQTVTLTVEMDNGDLHQMVVRKPSPSGGNPRFLQQQVDSAIAELSRRAEDVILTHHRDQIAAR